MDVVTHAIIGGIVASPFIESAPLAASAFILGSVLPDLDSFSRVFGKQSFMRWHQTWTHSLFILTMFSVTGTAVVYAFFKDEPFPDCIWPMALGLGMVVHVLMDLTNTYGVALLLPFSKRRFSLEWIFFIDAGVLFVSALAAFLLVIFTLKQGRIPAAIGEAFTAFLLLYWLTRAALRLRAAHLSGPHCISLIPSALVPWTYLGCAREGGLLRTFTLNALTGRVTPEASIPIFDEDYRELLNSLPEYVVMSQLSPAYHVVEVERLSDRTRLLVRDLRHRNFKTRFGALEIILELDGRLQGVTFHV